MGFFRKKVMPSGNVDYIIVGLGNPGRQYENTRHNSGFLALDLFAEKHNVKINRIKFKGICGDLKMGDKRLLLLKPQTFMNNSGQSVTEAMSFYKVPPERVIVIFDDISLPVGRIRIRQKGSDGGQKGMRSIIYLSGSDQFPRVKIGIGAKPHPDFDLADWVLSSFKKDEITPLKEAIESAVKAVELIVNGDIQQAMADFN